MGIGAISSSSATPLQQRVGTVSAPATAAPAAPTTTTAAPEPTGKSAAAPADKSAASGDTTSWTPEALALIEKLKESDTAVRQHEQAHLAAAGGLAVSGASYTYQRGPNGVDYAIGGEVQIDTSPGNTPEKTIARAHQIQAAALAPADPSGQDRSVAAQAEQLEQQARAELAVEDTQKAVAPEQEGQQQQQQQQQQPKKASPAPAVHKDVQASVKRAYGVTAPLPPKLDTYA